ncbi:MAG TPA: NADH-quinone oxidoreductase subunit NuoK [Candidatus Azosocius sp. HAIN]
MLVLSNYLIFSTFLFSIGLTGVFINRKNIIILLMCIELILLAVNTNFIVFSHFINDLTGQIFVFFVLTVAAVEAAIGLAILIALFRQKNTIKIEDINTLKG